MPSNMKPQFPGPAAEAAISLLSNFDAVLAVPSFMLRAACILHPGDIPFPIDNA